MCCRRVTNAALACAGANFFIFCYLFIWLERIRSLEDAVKSVRWAAPAGGATFAATIVL